MIEFATERDLKIAGTYFEHKDVHNETWVSPDNKTKNQIDHVLIEAKHMNIIKNVRSYRGAEASSDHFLVKAKLKLTIPQPQNIKISKPIVYITEKQLK